jgi:class 3 adenylate cyclase
MHKEFRKLLDNATGIPQYVMAILIDIRGFTPFCQVTDSLYVATYLKKVYAKIIDNYFQNASFYKPTGDGLLIILPYTEETLKETANKAIGTCLKLLQDFGDLCKNEIMITFDTPKKIGIGITRGLSCCLISEGKILDYSGKTLNLASRLMDMARPSGIVLDSSFSSALLSEEINKLLLEDEVYVRGISEQKPVKVYYTKDYTLVPKSYKQPFEEQRWETKVEKRSLRQFIGARSKLVIPLDKRLSDEKMIVVIIFWKTPTTPEGSMEFIEFDMTQTKFVEYQEKGGEHTVSLLVKPITEKLQSLGVTENMELRIEIRYPVI